MQTGRPIGAFLAIHLWARMQLPQLWQVALVSALTHQRPQLSFLWSRSRHLQ